MVQPIHSLFFGKVRAGRLKNIGLLFIFLWLLGGKAAFAQEFSSTNFVDSNPVVNVSGGTSASTNFQLFSGSGQVIIGESSSSNFVNHAGFFYFPFVSTPALSATAGDAQASLSWTSAVGELGANINGYSIGQSTNAGGPYSFTYVGNILNSTVTGLTYDVTHYFVVRAIDSLGDSVVTSTEVSVLSVGDEDNVPPAGGGGGGGGGGTPAQQATVSFSGLAYPKSLVTLLKDGQIGYVTTAGTDGRFQISLAGVSAGGYIFVLYSIDDKGNRSSLFSMPMSIDAGRNSQVTGIFLSPTVAISKSEIKKGESITVFGQSAPNADIIISLNSKSEIFIKTKADAKGVYSYNLVASSLTIGSYLLKVKVGLNGEISPYSNTVYFSVVDANSVGSTAPAAIDADFNDDGRVDLIDFSILAYWFKRPLTEFAKNSFDLSRDGKIDLIDFSIMVYYWTG